MDAIPQPANVLLVTIIKVAKRIDFLKMLSKLPIVIGIAAHFDCPLISVGV
jgi:hypothetical protein